MAKKRGIPYMGGKSKIADWVLEHLPKADNLVDLFAGGCSITHAALESGKYKHVYANDITDSVKLFEQALNGELEGRASEWISREDFFARKATDAYVRIIYSFGNNQRDYLYSREIEPYKRAVHEMIYAPTPNERRLKFREVIRQMDKLGMLNCSTDDCRLESSEKSELPPPQSQEIDSKRLGTHRTTQKIQAMKQLEHIERHNGIRTITEP